MTYTVGLIGARGYVGRELMTILARDPNYRVSLATSRQLVGKSFVDAFACVDCPGIVEDISPAESADRQCDIYILGLPNGHAAPYVEAIERARPSALILDLSTDHRDKTGWIYGLPEITGDNIPGARRVANPGCYATAGILALHPVRDLINGVPAIFGISGYSGAGTTPGPNNDPVRLDGNIIPYGFMAHAHEAEISRAIGAPVRFTPHVAQFFRGLICTAHARLSESVTPDEVISRYRVAYARSEILTVQVEPPELRNVVGVPGAIIGGMTVDPNTRVITVACVLDNLLKGAASQAMQNIRLALA